jgi:iron only hydrogenase large subunit-like protein
MTSSVILDDVDDYLAPSQACINPAFQPKEATKEDEKKEDANEEDDKLKEKETTAVVVPRRRRRRPAAPSLNNNNNNNLAIPQAPSAKSAAEEKDKDPVKASIADCLACSGCVTTAETVLMEQRHSLTSLKNQLPLMSQDHHRALLISPASLADLCRHLGITNNLTTQRQLTTLFHQLLHVSLVVDGNLPLIWSLQAQAEEFCRLYQQGRNNKNLDNLNNNNNHNYLPTPPPSTPIDATQTTVYTPEGTQTVPSDHDMFHNQVPVVSGSCPAVVCLVEKSKPDLVTHLSAATSPMSLTGGILKSPQYRYTEFWSIMPCHDKKLEASRPDFLQPSANAAAAAAGQENNETTTKPKPKHLVDLVITTQECVQLLQEWLGETINPTAAATTTTTTTTAAIASVEEVTTYLQQLSPSQVVYDDLSLATRSSTPANGNHHEPIWATVSHAHTGTHQSIHQKDTNDKDNNDSNKNNTNTNTNTNTINPYVSGGHADYIFTYAAKALFGVSLESVPWKPVLAGSSGNNSRIIKSARLAKRSKDYHKAVLYQNLKDGSYSTETPLDQNKDHFTPVLTFAMAYGMQTLQRVLDAAALVSNHLDYVEAMACPSGCVNGGGQNKVRPFEQHDDDDNANVNANANANASVNTNTNTNTNSTSRETPTQTRQRVGETQQQLQVADDQLKNNNKSSTVSSSFETTRYHVVPPMQYAMGAAAGVAVQELQW